MEQPIQPGYGTRQAYTPAELADKIRAASSAIQGERKQISVVFADVEGYTALSERLDPEEVQALMRQAFDVMLEAVHRFEGTVAQLQGDGMLALFGAPIAHEDHAVRAIRAGLAMQEGLRAYGAGLADRGIDFGVRVGVHSGLVVFGAIGTDLEFTFQAVGDTVNSASRVQGLGRPGTVVVSETTKRSAEGYFVFDDRGEHEVKNKAAPVHVFEVSGETGLRSRIDVSAVLGLGPFVGRSAEIDLLLDRYAEAREGRGQVVFISGEAGLGKSRLIHELRARVEAQDEDLLWLTGRCISYGSDISYVPVVDIVQAMCSIDGADPAEEIDRKLTDRVARLGVDAEHLPYLRLLLSIDPGDPSAEATEPSLRKARTFEAIRDAVLAASVDRPVVIVVEDLHWTDPLSAELLSYLVGSSSDRRLLVLLTHRPDWESRLGDAPNFARLDLRTLTADETAEVARGAFGDLLPPELEALVSKAAEGNPFFAEEVTKSLVEAGAVQRRDGRYVLAKPIEQIDVPGSVQDVIMARLDRLPAAPRQALQTASVIGREFTSRLLERTAGDVADEANLRQLKSVQLIFERSLYPELVFMFKHALTHEVAYGSLLLQTRRTLHAAVGDAVAELYRDRLPEVYETLAHHYERAQRWEEAATYLERSADKALASFAPQQAATYATRAIAALEHTGHEPDATTLTRLYETYGIAHELMNDWERANFGYDRMREAAARSGDRATEGRAVCLRALGALYAHMLDEGANLAREGGRIAEEVDDDDLRAFAMLALNFAEAVVGDLERPYARIQEGVRLARAATDPFTRIIGLDFAGELLHFQGEEAQALALLEEAGQDARGHDLATPLLYVYFDSALAYAATGRYNDALTSAMNLVELSERVGDQGFWWCRGKNTLAWIHMDLCDWEEGRRLNEEAIDRALVFGEVETLRNAQLNLGDCALAVGDPDKARQILEAVERACADDIEERTEWMKWRYTQHLWFSLSATWSALEDPERALIYADRVLAAARQTGTKRYVARGGIARANALVELGRAAEAVSEADAAVGVATELGTPALIWRAHAARGAAAHAAGEPEAARAAYDAARATLETVAQSLAEPALRDTVLGSDELAGLRAASSALT